MGTNESNTNVVVRWLKQTAIFTLIFGASLFISSGQLGWVMAWAYLSVFVAGQAIVGLVLIPNNPELAAERAQFRRDAPYKWDRPLTGIVSLFGPVATLIVAGLDVRHGWSLQIPFVLQIAALAIVVLGTLLTIWAMAANRYFYGFVRIETERGHTVATGGPYRIVRHPGYAGGVLFDLAVPLMLGSLWALIPAGLTTGAIILRTALEDQTLQDELDGYKEYAGQVRYRLLPGIW
jgi:protein-S-isoprenylcysteine O-methyltransferase Ste14